MNKTHQHIVDTVLSWISEHGYTNERFAKETGISPTLFHSITSGKTALIPKRIISFAKVMNVPVQTLFPPPREKPYSLKIRGETTSMEAKEDLRIMEFAIEDYMRIKKANEQQRSTPCSLHHQTWSNRFLKIN